MSRVAASGRVNAENYLDVAAVLAAYRAPDGTMPKGDALRGPARAAIARALNDKLGVTTFTPDTVKELLDGWRRIAGRFEGQARRQEEVDAAVGDTLHASQGRASTGRATRRGSVGLQVVEAQRHAGASPGHSIMSGLARSSSRGVAAALMAVSLGGLLSLAAPAHAQMARDVAAAATRSGARPASVGSAAELVERWSPHQHLWTIGQMRKETQEVGTIKFSKEQLQDLAAGLQAKGKNWTVVLVEKGKMEKDGPGENTADAKTLAVGLARQRDFRALVDSRTGEANGNLLVITFNAQYSDGLGTSLAYFGGPFYDARGLGEDHWAGELDATFKKPWEAGYNLVDAVLQTVETVEARATREVEGARAAVDRARAELDGAGKQVDAVSAAAEAFRQEHPKAVGDMVNPDTGSLRRTLADAEALVSKGQLNGASTTAKDVAAQTARILEQYQVYAQASGQFRAFESDLAAARRHEFAAAGETNFTAAARSLATARTAYDVGSTDFSAKLGQARSELARGVELSAEAKSHHDHAVFIALLGLLAVAVSGAMLWLRSHAHKKTAQSDLKKLSDALKQTAEQISTFLDKTKITIGATDETAKEAFDGESEALALKVLAHLRNAIVYQSALTKRQREASSVMQPPIKSLADLFKAAVSLFWPARYDRAIAMISTQQFTYKPGDAVAVAIKGVTNADQWLEEVAKPLGAMQGFELSAQDLIAKLNAALAGGTEEHKAISTAEDSVDTRLTALESGVVDLEKVAAGLSSGEVFKLPGLTDVVAKGARGELAAGKAARSKDPVGVMNGQAVVADRYLTDGKLVAQVADDAQRELVPEGTSAAQSLGKNAIDTKWIATLTLDLSNQLDAVARGIDGKRAVDQDLADASAGIAAARARFTLAVEQDTRRVGPSDRSVKDLVPVIFEARQKVAAKLGLAPEKMLSEKGEDPSVRTTAATTALAAAKVALDTGDAAAARRELDTVDAQVRDGRRIVNDSLAILASHAADVTTRQTEGQRVTKVVGEDAAIMRKAYAPNVLADLGQRVADAQTAVATAAASVKTAEGEYQVGSLLASKATLEAATAVQAKGLERVAGRRRELETADAANAAGLKSLQGEAAVVQSHASDSRARATQRAQQALAQLGTVAAEVTAAGRDPGAVAQRLSSAKTAMNAAEDALQSDFVAHSRAVGEIAQAEKRVSATVSGEGESFSGGAGRPRLDAAQQALRTKAYEAAADAAKEAYGLAERALSDGAAVIARLKQKREAAEGAMRRAASRVSDSVSGEGEQFTGAAGAASLQSAESYAARREYDQAKAAADRAYNEADAALLAGKQTIERKRQTREAAEAEVRRQAQVEADRRAAQAREAEAERERQAEALAAATRTSPPPDPSPEVSHTGIRSSRAR